MKAIKTFGEQLREILSAHNMSATALATELNMNGVIGISRLLRNQTSDKKQRELIDALRARGDLFSSGELAKLEKSIDVNRLGKRAYKTQRSIEELIFRGPASVAPPVMAGSVETLASYLQKLPQKEPLQLLCFNCIENGVLAAIESLFADPKRVIEMHHYVSINEDTRNPALVVGAAAKLLFDPRYHLYIATNEQNGSDAYFFTPCLLVLKQGVGQIATESLMLFTSDGTTRMTQMSRRPGMLDTLMGWIAGLAPAPKPIMATYGDQRDTNMIDLFFSGYQLEKKRAYYQIKPDLCSGSFPPELMIGFICDSPMVPADLKQAFRGQLAPILNARYQNLVEKTQPTYFTCSPAETKAFLSTGMLSDHPVGARPFTVEERKQIVDSVMARIRDNPRYHFRFLLEDLRIRLFQFIGYEGKGVMAIKRDTHYDLAKSQDNIFIPEPMFLAQYIDYYMETLLPSHTYSEPESLAMLQKMRETL